MNDELSKVREGIISYSDVCPMCRGHQETPYSIWITSIESDEEGWRVSGRGRYIEQTCQSCGKIYQTLVHIIPIQCAGIPCPNCGKLQNLHYKIHDIKTSKYSFKFEAKIECKKCDMKKSFTKVLGKISEIIRIDVKPTGITATLKEG